MKSILSCLILVAVSSTFTTAQDLPFKSKVEVYRAKEGEMLAFALRLEQPFLAEEFEKIPSESDMPTFG